MTTVVNCEFYKSLFWFRGLQCPPLYHNLLKQDCQKPDDSYQVIIFAFLPAIVKGERPAGFGPGWWHRDIEPSGPCPRQPPPRRGNLEHAIKDNNYGT